MPDTEVKQEKPKKKIIEVLVEDFKLTVDAEFADDLEVIEIIDDIESDGKTYRVAGLLKYMLGVDQYKALKAHFTTKYGKVNAELMVSISEKIFEAFDPKG